MITFENATNLEKFKEMVENGTYAIEKDKDGLKITHNLYHNMPYVYGLQKVAKNEFVFWSKNDEYFFCNFRSVKNKVEILFGEKSGRKCKSDRTLKQFSQILCLANSVLQLYHFEI